MAIGSISGGFQSETDYQGQVLVDRFKPKASAQSAPGTNGALSEDKFFPGQNQQTGLIPEQRDTFELSPQMQAALDKAAGVPEAIEKEKNALGAKNKTQKDTKSGAANPEKSAKIQQYVAELKAIDSKVRAHEAAHLAAAGSLARGGASYKFQTGPDGKKYAVAGEVSIDSRAVDGDAKATLIKAQRIQRAALAPADPSAQDRAVAASAASMASQAQAEISRQVTAIKKPVSSSSGGEKPLPVSQPSRSPAASTGKLFQTNQAPPGTTRFDLSV